MGGKGGKVGGNTKAPTAQTAQKKQQRSASAGGAAGGDSLGCRLLPFDLVSAPGGWEMHMSTLVVFDSVVSAVQGVCCVVVWCVVLLY